MAIIFPEGTQQFPSKLVQVQISSTTSSYTRSGNSAFADIGLSDSITMTSSSNKVLVIAHIQAESNNSNSTNYHEAEGIFRCVRGSTAMHGGNFGFRTSGLSGQKRYYGIVGVQFEDSPGSGTHTYKMQFGGVGGGSAGSGQDFGASSFQLKMNDPVYYNNMGSEKPVEVSSMLLIEYEP